MQSSALRAESCSSQQICSFLISLQQCHVFGVEMQIQQCTAMPGLQVVLQLQAQTRDARRLVPQYPTDHFMYQRQHVILAVQQVLVEFCWNCLEQRGEPSILKMQLSLRAICVFLRLQLRFGQRLAHALFGQVMRSAFGMLARFLLRVPQALFIPCLVSVFPALQ